MLFGSGTQALAAALRLHAAGSRADRAVALPAYCCYDVASAAVGANARVLLYDLDPRTLAPDLVSLERALLDGARVVVVAPLYGVPVDMAPLSALATSHGAALVEDAAQAQGAFWRGRRVGALAETSVLSFGRGKGWTGGAGGALLLRGDAAGAADALVPAEAPGAAGDAVMIGKATAQALLASPNLYGLPASLPWLHLGETRYHAPTEPRSISNAVAALVLETEEAAGHEVERRRANAARLDALLDGLPRCHRFGAPDGAVPGWLRYPVRLAAGTADVLRRRGRRLGVAAAYPDTLAHLPALAQRLTSGRRVWPGAEALVRELVTLPTHSRLRQAELIEVVRLVEDTVRGAAGPARLSREAAAEAVASVSR